MKGHWTTNAWTGRPLWVVGCVPAGGAGRFTRWLNFNPASMELRWRFHLWRAKGNRWENREAWERCVRGSCKEPREVVLGLLLQNRAGTWLKERA